MIVKRMQPHKFIKEVLRHYLEFEEYGQNTGQWTIEFQGYMVSFLDLQKALTDISPRKKEALFYNVILDWKQAWVAERMGIQPVAVGQYVDQACIQLAKKLNFTEDNGR